MSSNFKEIRSLRDLKALEPGQIGQSASGKFYIFDAKAQKAVEVFPEEELKEDPPHEGQASEVLESQSEEGGHPLETETEVADSEVQPEDATPKVPEVPSEPTDEGAEVPEEEFGEEEIVIVEVEDEVGEKEALIKSALSLLDQIAQILKNL